MNELVMLFYNTPRQTQTFAMIRTLEEGKAAKYTCAIFTGENKSSLLIEPKHTAHITFSNRRTAITPLIYSTDNKALVKYKNIRDMENVLPPAARTQVVMKYKQDTGNYLISEDIDMGWVASNGHSYLSGGGLLTQDFQREGSPTAQFNSIYHVEMVPSTLVTIDLHIDEMYFYFCNVFNTREFYVGIPVYVRDENSPYALKVKTLNLKMREWLASKGIEV